MYQLLPNYHIHYIVTVKFKEVKRVFSVGVSSEFSCIVFFTIVTFLKLENVSKTQYLFFRKFPLKLFKINTKFHPSLWYAH